MWEPGLKSLPLSEKRNTASYSRAEFRATDTAPKHPPRRPNKYFLSAFQSKQCHQKTGPDLGEEPNSPSPQ